MLTSGAKSTGMPPINKQNKQNFETKNDASRMNKDEEEEEEELEGGGSGGG